MVIDVDKRCERCRELFSLLLDVGLSELELALVRSHLRTCSACRRFTADVEGATTLLRSAPAISPGMQIVLPRRRAPRRAAVAVLSSAAAIAAAATVAVIGLNGSQFGGAAHTASRQVAVRSDLSAMRLIRSRQLRMPSSWTNVLIRQIESD
jgi:predicted anti-sigma-YlaC factor YlaD